MVEQALLGGGIMSLHAYHLVSPSCRLQRSCLSHDSWTWCNGSLVQGYHCRMLWAANYDGRGSFNAYAVKMQSGASKAKCQRIKTHRFLGALPAMSFEVVME